jgi:elongation factor P
MRLLSRSSLADEMIDAPQFLKDGSEVFVFINTETEQPIGAELPEKIVVKDHLL